MIKSDEEETEKELRPISTSALDFIPMYFKFLKSKGPFHVCFKILCSMTYHIFSI